MKTNKKAILGMLVAIVISLGVMGGINETNVIITYKKQLLQ